MKIEIIFSKDILDPPLQKEKKERLREMIGEMVEGIFDYEGQLVWLYANKFFQGTVVETIEPIGYRINISQSPTSEARPAHRPQSGDLELPDKDFREVPIGRIKW